MKCRILFVDDDTLLLAGLRRVLRSHRDNWSMEFIADSQEAVKRITETPFDIVVSDMQMPNIDGLGVLQAAREHCGASARIMLSGQAELTSVLQAFGIAHQYLPKPCSGEHLEEILKTLSNLFKIELPDTLRNSIFDLKCLPFRQRIFSSILEELDQPAPSIERITALVAEDTAVFAAIKQSLSSGFFGQPMRVENTGLAIEALGLDLLNKILLGQQQELEARSSELDTKLESLYLETPPTVGELLWCLYSESFENNEQSIDKQNDRSLDVDALTRYFYTLRGVDNI